jgi:hypothetical protein
VLQGDSAWGVLLVLVSLKNLLLLVLLLLVVPVEVVALPL